LTIAEQVRALRASAGLSRAAHVAIVQFEGPDAFDLLQFASTQAPYLREGQVRHTLLLRDDGGILADAYIASADDGFYVLAEGPGEDELIAWFETLKERRSPRRRAEIQGRCADWVALGLDGPYAWEVLAGLLGPMVIGMPYLTLLRREDILCVRAGKTGEYGYLLVVPRSAVDQVEARLWEVGGPIDLVAVGRDALDVCALENWHFSMRFAGQSSLASPLTPVELQLQWRVVYEREFVGAPALRARRGPGARARATCFVAEGPVTPNDRVRIAGEDVGEVLAVSFSPILERWIGSVLLPIHLAHPHLTFLATTADSQVALKTCTTPLVDNISLHIDPHKHSYAAKATETHAGSVVR
jgi:glycine cleavage system aminomethyltransferase T